MQSDTDDAARIELSENTNVKSSNENYGGFCKGICENYIALRPISGDRYANGQVRCTNCEVFLNPEGSIIRNGRRACICCNFLVRTRPRNTELKEAYFQKVQNGSSTDTPPDPIIESIEHEINRGKKSTPTFVKTDPKKKTYDELKQFIDELNLHANYQLVMLKHLISHKSAYRAEIAESLAYFNNKDTSRIDNVKEFIYVPVYEVLVRHGFVTENRNARYFNRREFTINVELNEYEQYEIDQLLQKKIEEWNKIHGIPENQFENEGINWNLHRELTREVKYWIWSVSEENWEKLNKENIWGSKVRPEELMEWVLPKDQIIFYVIGSKSFKGIFEITDEWFDDSKNLRWFDEKERREIIYQSAVPIKPVILGTAKVDDLEQLSIFSNKDQNLRNLVLKGESGFPSNKRQPVPRMDYEIIRNTLETNPPEHARAKVIEDVQEKSTAEENSSEPLSVEVIEDVQEKSTAEENSSEPLSVEVIEDVQEKSTAEENSSEPLSVEVIEDVQEKSTAEENSSEPLSVEVIEDVQEKSFYSSQVENETEIHISPKNSELGIRKTFETSPVGLIIKDTQELKEEIIVKGARLTNDELSEKFGVGNMGGIRYSKRNNLIVLCETESGHYHDDRNIDFGLFFYTGEGITGDQVIRGGNYRLIHSENIPIFYFVEEPQEAGKKKRGALDNIYRYVAKVRYLRHIIKTENDITGQPRLVIKFLLETEN